MIARQRGHAEAQLAATPSVLLDAIALVIGSEDARALASYKPAIDFVSDAFAHLKAIAAEDAAKPLLDAAGVTRDEGVVDLDPDAFVKVAARRFHDRERAIW
ncbi:hypothetical protein [Paracoccus sp. (in: a-proteobacteria)]